MPCYLELTMGIYNMGSSAYGVVACGKSPPAKYFFMYYIESDFHGLP